MNPNDDAQRRLQEYDETAVDAPPVEEVATCRRCDGTIDDAEAARRREGVGRAEHQTGYYDISLGGSALLCGECHDLVRYLKHRHQQLTTDVGVTGAVAIHCECHDGDEVEVRPVRRGDTPKASCSRCGSQRVVVEELPPEPAAEPEVRQ